MANSLKREIKEGEVVVLKKKIFKPQYQELSFRLFKVEDGFGMSNITHGTAIFGNFVCDGEKARMEGTDIDKKETEKYQKENPAS